MWAFQLHFVVDNRFEFEAQIPSGPAISPNNDPYDPGITYQTYRKLLKVTPPIAIEKIKAEKSEFRNESPISIQGQSFSRLTTKP